MILYVFILLFIILPYSKCDPCVQCGQCDKCEHCKYFPIDDVDLDLRLPLNYNEKHCGNYGFRCLSKREYEICELPQDRHSPCLYVAPERYKCNEGYECDEDNQSYCTPLNMLEASLSSRLPSCYVKRNLKNELNENIKDDRNYIDELESNKYSDDVRDSRHCHDHCDGHCEHPPCNGKLSCFDLMPTTTDPPEITTPPPRIPVPPMIIPECEYHCCVAGFYPDPNCKSSFWNCDIANNGVGFNAIHMKCKIGEIFSKTFHACVIPQLADECLYKRNAHGYTKGISFSCKGKRSGKYSDIENCRYYHLCLNNKKSPIRELLFVCPESTAYDPKQKRCTRSAVKRCINNCPQPREAKFCKGIPSRFRKMSDCKSYYLCTNNDERAVKVNCPNGYKVDDVVMDCLPKQIARCAN